LFGFAASKEYLVGGFGIALLPILFLALVFAGLIALLAWAKRGDGRTDLRRCPRCWYDMRSLDGLQCPECGHAAKRERELFRARPRQRAQRGATIALAVLVPVAIWFLLPAHWTRKTPPILLRGLLAIQGTPALGPAGIPAPRGGTSYPNHGWHNLVWAYDVGLAIDACVMHVQRGAGPLGDDEFADLAAKLAQMHDLYNRLQVMPMVDGWPVDRARLRTARAWQAARAEHGDADPRTIRLAWVLSEAQFPGALYDHRPDWTTTPDAIIEQALAHPSAVVRQYGLSRLSNRVHLSVMREGALRTAPGTLPHVPAPPFREIVDQIAGSDPDATTQSRARDLQSYWDAFNPP
jgi:hypothetical protein